MARSVTVTVPKSNLLRIQAANQECLIANLGAFWLHHPNMSHNKYICTQTFERTLFTGSIARSRHADMYEIALNIWEDKYIVMLTTNILSPKHEQTLKQAFQTISL